VLAHCTDSPSLPTVWCCKSAALRLQRTMLRQRQHSARRLLLSRLRTWQMTCSLHGLLPQGRLLTAANGALLRRLVRMPHRLAQGRGKYWLQYPMAATTRLKYSSCVAARELRSLWTWRLGAPMRMCQVILLKIPTLYDETCHIGACAMAGIWCKLLQIHFTRIVAPTS
jgi:hypothetical protein